MLAIIIWIIISCLFIISFVGLLYPIIPSSLIIWIGFLLYYFVLSKTTLSPVFWVAMVILTIILFVADIAANSFAVKKFGGSKWGERAAAVAVIAGSFIIPPFGVIIVPIVVVFIVELLQRRTPYKAFMAAIGSLIGFLSGTLAKALIQLIMIIWFIVAVII